MRATSPARLGPLLAAVVLASCGGATSPDRAGPPTTLRVVSGDGQTATVATLLPSPLVVTVTDAQARPVPGAGVTWSVTSGNGVVTPASPTTDSTGTVRATFTVGTIAGANQVTASISGVTTTVTFTLTGTPGPLAQVLAVTHSLTLCQGATGTVSAIAADQFGNSVSAPVTWVSRNPAVVTVDAQTGLVKLITTASAYVVATAGTGATPDSVLISGALPLSMAAGDVVKSLPGSSFCVQSNQAGSEFALVAFYNSTAQGNTTSLNVLATGIDTIGATTNLAANRVAAPAMALPTLPLQPDVKFEYALRQREHEEMPKYVAGARAWYANMQRQRAAGAAAPAGVSRQQIPATAHVGDLVQLNTNSNDYCTNPIMATGRIAAISSSAIVVSDTSNPSGGFTDAEYMSFAVAMDTLVNPVDTTAFGAPSDIDHNGRTIIFFTKAVNQLTTNPANGVVLGFYYSRDLLPLVSPQGVACPGSNVAEMFYLMVPDTGGTINGGNSFSKSKANVANIVVSTVGHEYQHLINASRRMYIIHSPIVDEDTWLNEGLSHIAEELIFYRSAQLAPRQNIGLVTLSDPRVWSAFGQFMWGNQGRYQTFLPVTESHGPLGEFLGDDDLPTRGAIWSLLRYLADRTRTTDGNFWYQLVNSQTVGMANLQQVLGTDPTPYFRDWATAVFTDDFVDGVAPQYTQPSWNWREVYPLTHGSYVAPLNHSLVSGVAVPVTVSAMGVSYFRFHVANGREGVVSVSGAGGAPLPSAVQLTLVRTK
ncbi:MAG TPA: Ig-like domain-containing protein [Gemmatimonadaceae bacterium]|nr:Ig-like domain-containing protein [Gemmatimonadaceae bacterium]